MLAYYVKQMIKEWYDKSEDEKGVFNQFISLRISFNAFYSAKYLGSTTPGDRDCVIKIASFVNNDFKVWCQEKEIKDFFDLKRIIPNVKIHCEIYELLDEYEKQKKPGDEFLKIHNKKAKRPILDMRIGMIVKNFY